MIYEVNRQKQEMNSYNLRNQLTKIRSKFFLQFIN